jgi:hypothetical protein
VKKGTSIFINDEKKNIDACYNKFLKWGINSSKLRKIIPDLKFFFSRNEIEKKIRQEK